jgi:mevalonate kinase
VGVTGSAPGKLMLLGDHAVVYGHPCVVTAVNRRMWVTAEWSVDGLIHISSPELRIDDWTVPLTRASVEDSPRGVRYLLAAVCTVAQQRHLKGGLRLLSRSDFSDELGLGSSSAVTAAAIAAVSGLTGSELTKDTLLGLARRAVLSVQGLGSGFDVAAAIYGGTVYYRYTPGTAEGSPLIGELRSWDVLSLGGEELPLVVGYSGSKANTTSLVRRVAQKRRQQPELVDEIFHGMTRLVEDGRGALLARDWVGLGQAMSLSQSLLEALGVSTPRLAQLVTVAEEAGAYGAKLSGAGGGDCMIALVSDERKDDVIEAIRAAGGDVIPLLTAERGLWTRNGPSKCLLDTTCVSRLIQ